MAEETMKIDRTLRMCYGVLLVTAVLSPYVAMPRALVTLPMCLAVVYISAMLSLNAYFKRVRFLIQVNDNKNEDDDANNQAQNDNEDVDEQHAEHKYSACTVLLSLVMAPFAVVQVLMNGILDAIVDVLAVLVGVHCVMGAFGPLLTDALRRVLDGRLVKLNVKVPWCGSIVLERSWSRMAMLSVALVLSMASVSTKHVVLQHMYGFAVIVRAIDVSSRNAFLLVAPSLISWSSSGLASSGFNGLHLLLEALKDAITKIKLPMATDEVVSGDHGAVVRPDYLFLGGLFIASNLLSELWDAHNRGERIVIASFDKPTFRVSLAFYAVGFVVAEIVASVTAVAQPTLLYADILSMVAVYVKRVKRRHVTTFLKLLRALFKSSASKDRSEDVDEVGDKKVK